MAHASWENVMSSKGTVLVTGAGRRIGKAIALDLAGYGYHVAIHANRSGADAEAVAGSIRDAGGVAEVFLADLCETAAVRRLHHEVSSRLGSPDVIVNNASVFEDDEVQGFDEALFDRHFAIHLKAPVILAEAMATGLPDHRAGLIVNIIDPDDFAMQAASVPLGHGPQLAEFGATIRYLHATRSVTGQMIALDGGQHLAWQTPDVSGDGE